MRAGRDINFYASVSRGLYTASVRPRTIRHPASLEEARSHRHWSSLADLDFQKRAAA